MSVKGRTMKRQTISLAKSPWKGLLLTGSVLATLVACGDDSGKSNGVEMPVREVSSIFELGPCNADRQGDTILVLDKASEYLCSNSDWVEIATPFENGSSGNVEGSQTFSSSSSSNVEGIQTLSSSSSFVDNKTADSLVVKEASIMGAAHKGPFKFNSPIMLREAALRNDSLVLTGRNYIDEVSSNKGDFVIPKVSLVSPYAVLEVRGLWKNEVSGEWSNDSMTLYALTDLSNRDEVNINLLTHLEIDRAQSLINKGYSVYAAKKQAEFEIMTAFGFATTVENAEDLKTYVSSGDAAHDANATLMAISLLFIGERSDAEIQNAINNFKRDLAEDGVWDDEQTKANMADWAEGFEGGSIRANVKSWNILDIPNYENFLTFFWNNAYELGGCDSTRLGVVAQNKNEKSRNYNTYYICKTAGWQKATELEYDTYQFGAGNDGELRNGMVNNDKYYVYENGAWRVSVNEIENNLGACVIIRESEKHTLNGKYYICENKSWKQVTAEEYALGYCTAAKNNVVEKIDDVYYICKSENWTIASVLEYDTYGKTCLTDGSIVSGEVVPSNKYVCDAGVFRVTNGRENSMNKGCVSYTEDEKRTLNNKYYICENKAWKQITAEEYTLGYCTTAKNNVVEKIDDVYYICNSENWTIASVLEYDTYGKSCLTDGSIVSGEVDISNKYVCDAQTFRVADSLEVSLNKGCVSYTEGHEIRVHLSSSQDSTYLCNNSLWKATIEFVGEYGTITDTRDGKTYKTVAIGTQTWMAENLNFETTDSYCHNDNVANRAKYGCLYTWADAMDSVGAFSVSGKNCGSGKTCSPRYPVRGICPNGWHLPTEDEYKTLFKTIGGESRGALMLKSLTGWVSNGDGIDAFGFSALPAGGRNGNDGGYVGEGSWAMFWSSTEYSYSNVHGMALSYEYNDPLMFTDRKYNGRSIRCLQD